MATDISWGFICELPQMQQMVCVLYLGLQVWRRHENGLFSCCFKEKCLHDSILKSTICIVTQQVPVHTGKICHLYPAVLNLYNTVCKGEIFFFMKAEAS